MEGKIKTIYEKSFEVLSLCSLENGAILASNSELKAYPKEAKNYHYIWPRDAAFIGYALSLSSQNDTFENFLNWLDERAENLACDKLLYEKYHPNGLKAGVRFQPDQNATLIHFIDLYISEKPELRDKFVHLIESLADGIVSIWKNYSFAISTNDIWEERLTFPDLEDNFTYSLAATSNGLKKAATYLPKRKYVEASDIMQKMIVGSAADVGHFYRSFGKIDDIRVDASLLGLVWPFEIVKDGENIHNTLNLIINNLSEENGIHRYEHDEYDGWMHETVHRKKGSGYWPLLNLWLAIALSETGRKKEALVFFNKVVEDIQKRQDLLIPEQIFSNDIQKSPTPLAWAHAMFIIATHKLNLI